MVRFACLRAHSWDSWLEGVSSPDALLARALECGYTALALTDTNTLCGAVEFSVAAQRHGGIRLLLGADLRQQTQRATVLVAEPSGYASLCRILSRLHAPQKAPHLATLLAEHAEGLHLLVDDPFLLKPPLTDAYRGRLWLEIVRPGKSESAEQGLILAGSKLGLKPVASLAARFAAPAEYT